MEGLGEDERSAEAGLPERNKRTIPHGASSNLLYAMSYTNDLTEPLDYVIEFTNEDDVA